MLVYQRVVAPCNLDVLDVLDVQESSHGPMVPWFHGQLQESDRLIEYFDSEAELHAKCQQLAAPGPRKLRSRLKEFEIFGYIHLA